MAAFATRIQEPHAVDRLDPALGEQLGGPPAGYPSTLRGRASTNVQYSPLSAVSAAVLDFAFRCLVSRARCRTEMPTSVRPKAPT